MVLPLDPFEPGADWPFSTIEKFLMLYFPPDFAIFIAPMFIIWLIVLIAAILKNCEGQAAVNGADLTPT